MLIWYFSNNLDIYDYVGILPEQLFSVWLFSNAGDNILFLLKFYEVMIIYFISSFLKLAPVVSDNYKSVSTGFFQFLILGSH